MGLRQAENIVLFLHPSYNTTIVSHCKSGQPITVNIKSNLINGVQQTPLQQELCLQGDMADGHFICCKVFFYTSSAALEGLLKGFPELTLSKQWQ